MDNDLIVLITIVTLLVFLAARVPVAMSLIIASAVGIFLLDGVNTMLVTLGQIPFTATTKYGLSVVPLFILMGVFAQFAGMGTDAYRAAARYLRWLPGGVGVATIFGCAVFAAVCGSSVATVATLGRTAMKEMRRYGYPDYLAAGIICTAGTLGILIPPSIMIVIYGIIAQASIGQLLIAAIIPGIICVLAYGIYTVILAKRLVVEPGSATAPVAASSTISSEAGSSTSTPVSEPRVGSRPTGRRSRSTPPPIDLDDAFVELGIDRPASTWSGVYGVLRVLLVFLIVIGGIYFGLVTTTEAAALGAFATLLVFLIEVARKTVPWKSILDATRSGTSLIGMVFLLFIGASMFTYLLVASGTPAALGRTVSELAIPPLLIVVVILLLLLPLGMFLDGISCLLIVTPIVVPVVVALGYSPIWFGILCVMMIEIGLVTPPVGLNVFTLTGTTRGLLIGDAFRGSLYFVPVSLAVVALVLFIPDLALWLPDLAIGR